MKVLHSVHPEDFKKYDSQLIRERFHLGDLSKENEIRFVYTHYDRLVAGVAKPAGRAIILDTYDTLKSEFFLQRREMGVINVGNSGVVEADGKLYELNKLDALYLGKGARDVKFSSTDQSRPAVFFLLSCPAHSMYPTTLMTHDASTKAELGSQETANKRTLCKYIHQDGIQSCQLVMGLTLLHPGNIWNTMPPHTHDRRSEVYFYFDVPNDQVIFHYMGEPNETRHIVISNHEAIVSPSWSIHSGSGTSNYSFIWGMAGENMEFTDMDPAPTSSLR